MRTILVMSAIALCASSAFAQDTPITEVGFQYQMLRINPSRNLDSFTTNGGTGSVQVNFFSQVAAVLEVGATHNGDVHGFQLDNTWMTYLVGPRISLRNRNKKVIPALECLIGGTTLFASSSDPVLNGAHLGGNSTGFAMALGGTLDIRLSHAVNFRPVQLDYLLTRVNNSYNQNNWRYGTGLIFTFGKQ
jgi:hypothetical protein